MPFPLAPNVLPEGMTGLIADLARIWAVSAARPSPTTSVIQGWRELIETWLNDVTLPLYVRKSNNNRGSLLAHESGRALVPVDNSPAQWAFSRAVAGQVPSIEDIRAAVASDAIPVAMIMSGAESAAARYRCNLRSMGMENPNSTGWTVCHVERVGLATALPLAALPQSQLHEHFRKLMAPANMFVIPKKYSGLGELPEF